jgi:branched-chain amino acid transport system ATP-binding protein
MVAVARARVGAPKVLLLDEPLEGLAPIVIEALFEALLKIRDESGLSMILVEQKAELALSFARDCVVIDRGKIVHRGPSKELQGDYERQAQLLGVAE